MAKKYAMGIDFGSLSARALAVDVQTGEEVGSACLDYAHGVMDRALPQGPGLPPDWALQHPQDYLTCLAQVIPGALKAAGIGAEDIVGVGLDFTACTMLPLDRAGDPLCFDPAYAHNPHAYVKLWKHHAAQPQADRLNAVAQARGEAFLSRYGGKVSSEWMIPKIWQILEEDPALYQAAHRFMEAGDWIVLRLTGQERRSAGLAGYKALWDKSQGYPSPDFFGALDPRLTHVVQDKLGGPVCPLGARAGEITPAAARLTGLKPGTPVAVCNVDAHVSMPTAGPAEPGDLLMVMGTSVCHIALSRERVEVPGMSGRVEDGVIPGWMGYEANQVMGDHYNWLVDYLFPQDYARQAQARGMDAHALLSEKAQALLPGQSGLLALDWWNGNRSVLVDGQLSGLMLGMTLKTRPEEMYRALIEATAFGSRVIHETFEKSGIPIVRLAACGGIAQKNPLVMQIYADVLNREIGVVRSAQAPALGSAMHGAVAAGKAGGGYDHIGQAAAAMGGLLPVIYRPDPQRSHIYSQLYREYLLLHDYFGRGANPVMKRLKAIQRQVHPQDP